MHFRFRASLHCILAILFGTQSLLQIHAYIDHECYPPSSQIADEYLIGYASLMQKASKEGTHPHTGELVPIRIKGLERSWNRKGGQVGFGPTYLGVQDSTTLSATINAVYFKIPNALVLQSYDKREEFYCREEIDKSKISLVTKQDSKKGLPRAQFWIYVTRKNHTEPPTKEFPIVQSYVDKFIAGCLELEATHKLEGFAEECVYSTSNWNSPWVNDRIFPRRPFLYQKMAGEIDKLLHRTVHNAYKKIKIET